MAVGMNIGCCRQQHKPVSLNNRDGLCSLLGTKWSFIRNFLCIIMANCLFCACIQLSSVKCMFMDLITTWCVKNTDNWQLLYCFLGRRILRYYANSCVYMCVCVCVWYANYCSHILNTFVQVSFKSESTFYRDIIMPEFNVSRISLVILLFPREF
jgi:ABC-type long-subunit fatty acid transport system fused permease/ATPase subunit